MSEEWIYYLLDAYTNNTASKEEEEELFEWISALDDETVLKQYIFHLITAQSEEKHVEIDWEIEYKRIIQRIKKNKRKIFVIPRWQRLTGAAILTGLIIFGAYLLLDKNQQTPQQNIKAKIAFKNDISPGSTKAILQANDNKVILNNNDTSFSLAGNTVFANSGNLKISDKEPVLYTLITPLGGEYSLTLSDGTEVRLNAGSRLIYPSSFTEETRIVRLRGEAYFKVEKDNNRPFIVKLSSPFAKKEHSEIKVLGTEFNIQAYEDESKIITTLVTGKVKISSTSGILGLQKGQQAVLSSLKGLSRIREPDVEAAIAWKNGYFLFHKADIHTIMKKLERWYDIDVIYKEDLSHKLFGAIISRDNNISGILKMLEATGDVHFKIDGKTVIVKEKK